MVFQNTIFLQKSNKSINFDYDKQQQVQTPSSCYKNQDTTEIQSTIGVRQSWCGIS